MPALQEIISHVGRLTQQRNERKQQGEIARSVLPPDLTGQVFNNAKAAHDAREQALIELKAELVACEAELAAARANERSTYGQVMERPVRRKAHIFDIDPDFDFSPQPANGRHVITADTLRYRARYVRPLENKRSALHAHIGQLTQDIGELRKIGEAATLGDMALIRWLNSRWSNVILVGVNSGTVAKLASSGGVMLHQNAVYTDPLGNPLPPEALSSAGLPDLPKQKGIDYVH